ncbi:pentapeptide repeat-containing protein [Micromonospora sp. NPDC049102]|uniref:pentapeptide repeat-containing protein n=1 Tax=Micromonospora sp. NPDC049102 TaxID=3364265 RepID=UPI00371B64D7
MSRELAARTEAGTPARRRWPWPLSDAGIAISAALVIIAGGGLAAAMWAVADAAAVNARPGMHIEALKYGVGSVAAAAAAVGLLLSLRKQRMAEDAHDRDGEKFQLAVQAQRHTEADAAARRLTETYVKAAEQFASESVVVRLAGLYTLERVAQDNPDQRQKIVNLICAYLRMPYTPPTGNDHESDRERTSQLELQVRIAAQLFLSDHTCIPARRNPRVKAPETYWPDLHLDLTGAALIELSMCNSVVRYASFASCEFVGGATFRGSKFDMADFTTAQFTAGSQRLATGRLPSGDPASGAVNFNGAEFHTAIFTGADFGGPASFVGAAFHGSADFGTPGLASYDALKGGSACPGPNVRTARFRDQAVFRGATFGGAASFGYVRFDGPADFASVTAHQDVYLAGARQAVTRPGHTAVSSTVWPHGWEMGDDGVLVAIPPGPDGTWPEPERLPPEAGKGRRRPRSGP